MMKSSGRGEVSDGSVERLICWSRYLYWCDLNRKRLDQKTRRKRSKADDHFFALMAQWFASLWVVIEGWNALESKDQEIERVLRLHDGANAKLLKRFRHGVFHYQPRFLDDRLTDFVKDTRNIAWAHALHGEFLRFLWEYPRRLHGTERSKNILARQLKSVLGWMPDDIILAQIHSLAQLIRRTEAMLERDEDATSPAAQELRAILETAKESLKELSLGHDQIRDHLLALAE
jgi:hypothetical protein